MAQGRCWLGLVAMTSLSAYAAPYTCSGQVEVATGRGIELYLKTFAGSNWVALCSMAQTTNGVTADSCKNTYAMLLGAQLADRQVRIWFDDQLTCSTQQSWAFAAWYFGPELLVD